MHHKFRQVGRLRHLEDFFAEFWDWYQPRNKAHEIAFRKEMTELVFRLDETDKLEKREELLIEEIKRIRKEKIHRIKSINEKAAQIVGGPVESLSELVCAVEESIVALKPQIEEDDDEDEAMVAIEETKTRDLEDGII